MTPGILKSAVWIPDQVDTATQIAAASGLPEFVVREKMGIVQKCRAPQHVHPSDMAIAACQSVLAGEPKDSIDLLIWVGSEYKDYPLWSAGIFVQEALGLKKAWSFDASARCSSMMLGFKLACDLMKSDSKLERVLLCGGHRTGDLVNYADPQTRFLYNLSDGGAAVLLGRNGHNPVHHTAMLTDGSFSRDVILPAGGTRHPIRAGINPSQTYLQVPDMQSMRERISEKSLSNFVTVIKQAAQDGVIAFLGLVHIKRSAHDEILARLGLKQDQSFYLDHFGHFGAPDQILAMGLAEQAGRLKPGDLIVLASAGIGYTWAATALTWNRAQFKLIGGETVQESQSQLKFGGVP